MKEKPLLIGRLAKLAGVKPDTIRFYEQCGLLPKPSRTASGYRIYNDAALNQVRFIRKAQSLGFSLDEIQRIMGLRGQGRETCRCVVAMGAGYEIRAFHDAGWKVTAIDFSPVAVDRARSELAALASCVVQGDFFKHDFGDKRFDVIYERTFLCALPPTLWPAYVKRMMQLLRPGGKLVGIFLYGEEHDPPPYPLNLEKGRELFQEKFSLVKTSPVSDSLPMFAGNERWQEWMLSE